MSEASNSLSTMIRDVKRAVEDAQNRAPGIAVERIELELKSTYSKKADGGFEWGPVKIGGDYSSSQISTITMKMIPERSIELYGATADALADGIAAISAAALEGAATAPKFALDEASVTVAFGVDKSGKLTLLVGGEVSANETHTLKLSLKKAQ